MDQKIKLQSTWNRLKHFGNMIKKILNKTSWVILHCYNVIFGQLFTFTGLLRVLHVCKRKISKFCKMFFFYSFHLIGLGFFCCGHQRLFFCQKSWHFSPHETFTYQHFISLTVKNQFQRTMRNSGKFKHVSRSEMGKKLIWNRPKIDLKWTKNWSESNQNTQNSQNRQNCQNTQNSHNAQKCQNSKLNSNRQQMTYLTLLQWFTCTVCRIS